MGLEDAIQKVEIHNSFTVKNASSTRFRKSSHFSMEVKKSFNKKEPLKDATSDVDECYESYARKFVEANLTPIPEKDTLEPKYASIPNRNI